MRRRGGDQAGRESLAHLAAIESVLKAERLMSPELLEPLAAFTNLLQSAQLPPDFGDFSFGDALLAIEEAQGELRRNAPQHWEFEGEVTEAAAGALAALAPSPAEPPAAEHANQLRRFVLDAADTVQPGSLLVVGALAEPALPLAELCARFDRVTLSDLDLSRLEGLVRQAVPEELRARVKLERYDVTGSAATFAGAVSSRVAAATSAASAEEALVSLLQSYDVSAGSAGLSASQDKPNLAVSAMLLSRLGEGFGPLMSAALATRGFRSGAPLAAQLTLFRSYLVQHHIHALLRRAKAAVLVTAVSEVELQTLPSGKKDAVSEPRDLLGVERLEERLPEIAEIKAEHSWELARPLEGSSENRSVLTLVEALLV